MHMSHFKQGWSESTPLGKTIALALCLFALVGMARAGIDDYPSKWKNEPFDQGYFDTWSESVRNCTSFVAWRLYQWNGYNMTWCADASQWLSKSPGLYNHTPAVGAVAWFSYGHVAWVEAVNGSGSGQTVTIEEYN